jgi:hypothetical protein
MLPVLFALGGAGLVALGLRSGRDGVSTSGDRLRAGKVYRVRVKLVPGVYERMRGEGRRPTEISRFVGHEAGSAGFTKVFLAAEDPSAPGSYTLIAEYGGGNGSNVLTLLRAEEVEGPESAYVTPWSGPVLDDGLLFEEGEAILQALRESRDPKHLSGFASTLTPDFPIAASLLRARGELCLQLRSGTLEDDVRKKSERFAKGMLSVGVSVPAFSNSPSAEWSDILQKLQAEEGFRLFRFPQTLGSPEATWFGETCYRILRAIADGDEKVGRAVRQPLSEEASSEVTALRLTGGPLATLPGLGGGVAIAQYVGACFALMGARFEGLGDLGSAFHQAGQLLQVLSKTETLEKVRGALDVKEQVRFDVGVVVAETKLLRKAEFARFWHWLPGSDPAEKAAHLKRFLVLSRKASRPLRDVLLDDVLSGVTSQRNVYEAALMLTSDLVKRAAPEVADKLGLNPGDARAALASVLEVSEGVRCLRPDVIAALGPNGVARELLPPAAMQLAFATMRPEQSLVSNKEAAIEKARAIHRLAEEGGDAAKAKAQFDRAKRALDRQKWVDWMRRKRQAESGKTATGIIRS